MLKMDSQRKKKVSKKNKKSWIKHIDNADVEDFIIQDNFVKSSVSSAVKTKDDDLFTNDTSEIPIASKGERPLTKKEKARLPFKCRSIFVNNCPIPDPVGKRTRVKSKEERQCRIRKSINKAMQEKGILTKKATEALVNKSQTIKRKKAEREKELKIVPEYNIWTENKKEGPFGEKDTSWLGLETIKHHNKEVCPPKDLTKKKSEIPAVEVPHPGMSYNPSFKDHQSLLESIVEKEQEKLKEEAHVRRCTTDLFDKIKRPEKEARWLEEMSQGLVKEEDDNEEIPVGPLSFNPPTSFLNKKTLKQRRKQKEQKEAKFLRKQLKVEKKKSADIYKLKFIKKNLDDKESKNEISASIRKAKEELNSMKTKRLSRTKFVEPDLSFNMPHELRGSLRKMKPGGNMLADVFHSYQRRNMLAPSEKVTRFRKAKVKVFTKPSHKMEQPKTLSDVQKAFGKKKKKQIIS